MIETILNLLPTIGMFGIAFVIGYIVLFVLGLIIAAIADFAENIFPILIGAGLIAAVGAAIITAIF
jgi:hypothetical protein